MKAALPTKYGRQPVSLFVWIGLAASCLAFCSRGLFAEGQRDGPPGQTGEGEESPQKKGDVEEAAKGDDGVVGAIAEKERLWGHPALLDPSPPGTPVVRGVEL